MSADQSSHNKGSWIVKQIRLVSGLSRNEIAKRAQMSLDEFDDYEKGLQSPSLSSLSRIADAGGLEVQMTLRRKKPKLDPAVCGERLAQVLALADALPKRPAAAQGDKAQFRIEP